MTYKVHKVKLDIENERTECGLSCYDVVDCSDDWKEVTCKDCTNTKNPTNKNKVKE